MIKKLQENLWRITKDFSPFILLVFYQNQNEMIRLKVIKERNEPQQQVKKNYYKDFSYEDMPDLIRFNFQNLGEIFEEIRITSKDCFHFEQNPAMLKIALQIGSKVKHCLFQLERKEHTYLETVELLLWETEKDVEKIHEPDQMYFHSIQQLKIVNQSHTKEISQLYSRINRLDSQLELEKAEKVRLQQQFEAFVNQLRTEIYEIKLNYQTFNIDQKQQSDVSSSLPVNPRVEISSLIYEERDLNIEFINLDQEECIGKIEKYNHLSLRGCRFRLDANAGSDIDNAFQRKGQRLFFKKKDQKYRQFASLLQLHQPISLVNFKLLRTKEHNIYVGILLADQLKKNSSRREEKAISFKMKGSQLYQDGIRARINLDRVNPGQTLSLMFDGRRRMMQWWKSGKLLSQRTIPLTFQGREVYPFINMINEGDCIQFV